MSSLSNIRFIRSELQNVSFGVDREHWIASSTIKGAIPKIFALKYPKITRPVLYI